MNIFKSFQKKAANIYVTMVDNHSFLSGFSTTSDLSNEKLIENWETIPDLFLITDYLASQISNIPVKIVKPNGKPSNNADLIKLVEQPNYYQNWNELIKTFFTYYEPLGNAYMYGIRPEGFKNGMVTQLFCLPVDKTTVLLAQNKALPNWLNEVAGYQVDISNTKYNLEADSVLHKRYVTLRYNDGSWVYGISKYIPGDKVNRELKAIHDAKTSIIEKRGALGVLSNESEIPNAIESKAVQDKLKENFGLGGSQDKVIVTTEKLKWQQMSLGLQELQLIENAKYSFEKLCQLSGFDAVIFSPDGSTFANKELATKDLFRRVLLPKVNDFYNDLNQWIAPGYGGDMILPDWSKVEELAEDREKLTTMLKTQIESAMITPYKANEMLYGEVDSKNPPPDEYYIRTGLKPLVEPEPIEPAEGLELPLIEEEIKKLFKVKLNGD